MLADGVVGVDYGGAGEKLNYQSQDEREQNKQVTAT
jgi:hypothetical protein